MNYKNVFAALATVAITTACSSVQTGAQGSDGVVLMQRHDDLIRVYHAQPSADPMNRDQVLNALGFTFKDRFSDDATAYFREQDAFRRQERGDALFREYQSFAAKTATGDVVAVITDVAIKPYNLQSKRFDVCIGMSDNCMRYKSDGLKVSLGMYQLKVDMGEHGAYSFSPPEADARRIEALVSRLNARIVKAVVYARPTGVSPCDRTGFCTVLAKPFRIELKEPMLSTDWEINQYRYPKMVGINL